MKKLLSKVVNFFHELYLRWNSTSPYFFKIIRWISIPIMGFAGLATAIKAAGVAIPESLSILGDRAILIGAATAYIMSKLPVDMDKVSDQTKQKIEDNSPKSTIPE